MDIVIFKFNLMVDDFLGEDDGLKTGEDPLKCVGEDNHWFPPPVGWIKSNSDATFKGGRAAIDDVFRNHKRMHQSCRYKTH